MGDQWECLRDAFKLGGDGAESGADVGLPAVGRYRSHLIRSSAESGSDALLLPVVIKRPAKLVPLIEGGQDLCRWGLFSHGSRASVYGVACAIKA